MHQLHGKLLLIAYGNPGRLDDGLGPAVADAVQRIGLPSVTIESCYQLAVEHAEAAARHDVVIFADADASGPAPFRFDRIEPQTKASFSTHMMEPATVLGLARDVFGALPEGYLLGVRGYEFDDFGEVISPQARENLTAAIRFLKATLLQPKATRCEVV